STTLMARLLSRDGAEIARASFPGVPLASSWIELQARTGSLDTTDLTLSPFLAVGSRIQYEIAYPIAGLDTDDVAGFMVQTRAIRARGAETVQQLAASSTMLVGHPSLGAWNDLQVAAPPP